MQIPNTRLFAAGDILTGAMMNQTVTSLGNFLLGKPLAAFSRTTNTSAVASGTAVDLDSTQLDRDNSHSNVTNPSRYTAQTPGWYRVTGQVVFNTSTSGTFRQASIAKNGTIINETRTFLRYVSGAVPNNTLAVQATGLVYLNGSTDYIQLIGTHDTGGTLAYVGSTTAQTCYLLVEWVSL